MIGRGDSENFKRNLKRICEWRTHWSSVKISGKEHSSDVESL